MSTKKFHKLPALAFVSIFSLTTGCTNYGGGTYSGGYGNGIYGAGSTAAVSSNLGLTSELIGNVGSMLDSKNRKFANSARQSISSLEREAKRQERDALIRQKLEQRQQEKAQRLAQMEERKAAEERRWAALTPEQRKAEIDARNKRNEAIGNVLIWAIGNSMSGGGEGSGNGSCPDGSTPSFGTCQNRSGYSSPAPAPTPAPTPYYNGAVGVYSTGQGY